MSYIERTPQPSRHILARPLVAVSLILILGLGGCSKAGGSATATAEPPPMTTPAPVEFVPRPIVLPADEAPHSDELEWWYYNGHLIDDDGAEFGFHFVIFQGRTDGDVVGYMAHTGLSDLEAGTHDQAGRVSFSEQEQQPSDGFDLRVQDWSLNGSPGLHAFTTSTDNASLQLVMLPQKKATFHDGDGYLESAEGWSYYYSWTRMDATGTLSGPGGERGVVGTVWMDHQWGDFAVTGYPLGWQWFAVQFDDGTDIMVTEAKSDDGTAMVYGTLVQPDGRSVHINNDDITLTVLDTWRSPHTRADYPARWRISLNPFGLEIDLTPVIEDQEITVAFPPRTIYWEGVAKVSATKGGEALEGRAFVELVGFVRPQNN
jgi:predicted secreted hydrolase